MWIKSVVLFKLYDRQSRILSLLRYHFEADLRIWKLILRARSRLLAGRKNIGFVYDAFEGSIKEGYKWVWMLGKCSESSKFDQRILTFLAQVLVITGSQFAADWQNVPWI